VRPTSSSTTRRTRRSSWTRVAPSCAPPFDDSRKGDQPCTGFLNPAGRCSALAAALAAIAIPALALAGSGSDPVASYTGCLTSTGDIVDVAVGSAPLGGACASGQTQVLLSGGDVTSVLTPSTGRLTGGTDNGDANISLQGTYKLPQGCVGGQVAKFKQGILFGAPPSWECGNDNVVDRSAPRATTKFLLDSSDGAYGSITIGADGFGLISYWDAATGALKVAHCSNLVCSSATKTTIASARPGGTSATIGADGLGLISYWDAATGALKVAHCANVACSSAATYVIDTPASFVVGQNSSITIGADGLGLISYYDAANDDLKVAHCSNVACSSATTTTLDSVGDIGAASSITLGADGLGLISYDDRTNGDLKVAHCGDAVCSSAKATIARVDSLGTVGATSSLAIGADGLALISYEDSTNLALKVVHCGDAVCSSPTAIKTTIGGSHSGDWSSVTIGPDGLGLIGYRANGALSVAHCANVICSRATTSTVDGTSSSYMSITIGSDGLGLIGYLSSAATTSLKVAHCSNAFCVSYLRRR
jgi:hypothetical protein